MKCPKCHTENPETKKFCGDCGTRLTSPEPVELSLTKTLQTPLSDLAQGALFAGRYEILEELGAGGMGKVYKVKDTKIDEEMALKFLRPEIASDSEIIDRFKNELKLARKIGHRHICRAYDLHVEGTTPFITMEYVDGEDLRSFIKKSGPLSPDIMIRMAGQIAEGMNEAHNQGIIHRDLKSRNIMVDKNGEIKIMDFGISRSIEVQGFTRTGIVMGTPEYMPPEQAEGKDVDQRSDIYSLGVIMYEMTTGRLPFEADSALSIALKHKTEIPPDPRKWGQNIPDGLCAVILKCLAKDRENRYQSAGELLSDLHHSVDTSETRASIPNDRLPLFLAEEAEDTPEAKEERFVSREKELHRLNGCLDTMLAGQGQVIFITGEAGSGKSTLAREFCKRAFKSNSDLIVAGGKCNAYTGLGDPYLPFIEIMGLLTGDVEAKFMSGGITRKEARSMWSLIPFTTRAIVEKGPDLIDIFVPGSGFLSRARASIPHFDDRLEKLEKLTEKKASLPADAMLQQSSLFEQYTRVLQALASNHPMVLILDDLQWVDTASSSLLFHLGKRIQGSRILILGAYRPTEIDLGREGQRHPLASVINELKRDFGQLDIELEKSEGRRFIDEFLDSESNTLGEPFRKTLYRQTRGHPLYTIELLRVMQDQGVLIKDDEGFWIEGPELNWESLPARVDAIIEERISRLDDRSTEMLTSASVEGEEFTAEVVAELQKTGPREVIKLLSGDLDRRHHIVSAKGIRQLDQNRISVYVFRHILFQRHLYNSLDQVERALMHEDVGKSLEILYGDQTDEISVQLARHFLEAGVVNKAVEYLHKAGNRAVRLSANLEAIAHYKKALELVEKLPPGADTDQTELSLQLALIVPLQATQGFASHELGRAVVRARELSQKTGDPTQRFNALVQLATFYATRPEYGTALELQQQVGEMAEQSGNPVQTGIANYMATWALLNLGEFTRTVEFAKKMNDLYDPEIHGALGYIFGYDFGVLNRAFGSWALWFLGYPDQAQEQTEIAMSHARKLEHPHTLAFMLIGGCEMAWFLCNREAIKRYTEEIIPLSEEQGFIYWLGHGVFYRGEQLTLDGLVEDGLAEMQKGLEIMRMTGTDTCQTRLLCRKAEACRAAGEIDEGLSALEEAIEFKCKYEETYVEAEILRLKGELLLMKDHTGSETEAENLFVQSLEIARKQQAKSWELRTAMSLARLYKKRGESEKGRQFLLEIYNWFTEGFDTADLKEARAFLEKI